MLPLVGATAVAEEVEALFIVPGPVQANDVAVAEVAVSVILEPAQTGPLLAALTAGNELTVTVVVVNDEQPLPSVTVIVNMSPLEGVTAVAEDVEALLIVPGPVHANDVAVGAVAVKVALLPAQTGPLLPAEREGNELTVTITAEEVSLDGPLGQSYTNLK